MSSVDRNGSKNVYTQNLILDERGQASSKKMVNYYSKELEEKIRGWGENYTMIVDAKDYGSIDLKNKVVNYPPFESPDLFQIFEFLISQTPPKSYARWYAFGCSEYITFQDGQGKTQTIPTDDLKRQRNEQMLEQIEANKELAKEIRNTYTQYIVFRS